MKNNRTLGLAILSLLLFIGNAPLAAKVKNYTLSSPDGGLKVEISTGDGFLTGLCMKMIQFSHILT